MEDSVLVCSYEPMYDRTRIGSGSGPGPFLANRRRRRPGQIEMQLNSTWLTRRLKVIAERLADRLPTNKVNIRGISVRIWIGIWAGYNFEILSWSIVIWFLLQSVVHTSCLELPKTYKVSRLIPMSDAGMTVLAMA